MPFAQLAKVRLEYLQHGHGPERVLLIHGYQASARIWQMVQEALPTDRYTSVAINNRGAGASDAPADEADYGVKVFSDDAFEVAKQLGWSRFTLVGHSLGGATAAQFAIDHPDVLSGVILLDPADPDGREIAGGEEAMVKLLDGAMAARRAQQERGRPGDGIDASGDGVPSEMMRLLAADMRAAPEARLRGSMRSMFAVRLGAQLGALELPFLLAAGDKDELIPLAGMLATWAKLPKGAGLHVWHGVGHSPNLDRPAELAALIRQFVEETIPARGAASVGAAG
jgi:pimeloyl-ACP methyl ester carboxylesterase